MARDDIARLRALAGEKRFALERAIMKERWRLHDEETGELARNERGSAAFTVAAAIKFLRKVPHQRKTRSRRAATVCVLIQV